VPSFISFDGWTDYPVIQQGCYDGEYTPLKDVSKVVLVGTSLNCNPAFVPEPNPLARTVATPGII
jgi:hypothetical protein